MFICFKYYNSLKSVFFIKIHVNFWPRFFIFKFDLNVKHRSYFFSNKNHVFFSWRLSKNYRMTYCTHMTSHVIWVDVMVSRKNTGFDLAARDSYFTILVEVFTNHILVENTYFTNHIEWTEHTITALQVFLQVCTKLFSNVIILKTFLSAISSMFLYQAKVL